MMRNLAVALCCFALFLAGCGDSGVVAPEPDTAALDIGELVDTLTPQDTGQGDLAEPDTSPDVSSNCESGEGCFGEPCDAADDCLSGICTMHLGEKVCSKTCDANCPYGWS